MTAPALAPRMWDLLRCPICTLVLRDPVAVDPCGHVFCSACIEALVEAQPSPRLGEFAPPPGAPAVLVRKKEATPKKQLVKTGPFCRKGHALKAAPPAAGYSVKCDHCNKRIRGKKAECFGCRRCDFDVCAACAAASPWRNGIKDSAENDDDDETAAPAPVTQPLCRRHCATSAMAPSVEWADIKARVARQSDDTFVASPLQGLAAPAAAAATSSVRPKKRRRAPKQQCPGCDGPAHKANFKPVPQIVALLRTLGTLRGKALPALQAQQHQRRVQQHPAAPGTGGAPPPVAEEDEEPTLL